MRETVYLIFSINGFRGVRKTKPKLFGGEVAVKLNIEIPDNHFDGYIPTVALTVPEAVQITEDDVEATIDRIFEGEKPCGMDGTE